MHKTVQQGPWQGGTTHAPAHHCYKGDTQTTLQQQRHTHLTPEPNQLFTCLLTLGTQTQAPPYTLYILLPSNNNITQNITHHGCPTAWHNNPCCTPQPDKHNSLNTAKAHAGFKRGTLLLAPRFRCHKQNGSIHTPLDTSGYTCGPNSDAKTCAERTKPQLWAPHDIWTPQGLVGHHTLACLGNLAG